MRAYRLFIAGLFCSLPLVAQQETPPPHGSVIFSRSADQDAAAQAAAASANKMPELTDNERDALTFTQYALDVHLTPADAAFAVRARITVRNDGDTPLTHLALQLSSTLHWESIELNGRKLSAQEWLQHPRDTDADHTGQVMEAIITPATPLAPGATADLTAIYSGIIPQTAQRLTRIGAPDSAANSADWDRISPGFTGLRGFGNVLWYPVASPSLFLGDGARLFQAIGRMKLREAQATLQLRLTLEYTGATPSAVILNGESKPLTANGDEEIAAAAGIPRAATVEFSATRLGFRMPSLFLVSAPLAPSAGKASPLNAYTDQPELLTPYVAAAAQVLPLVTDWIGVPRPLSLVDLPDPNDQPFEANGLLALGLHAAQPSELTLQLAHALARPRGAVPPRAWMDEGLAQFIALLWMEQTHGREASVTEMNQHGTALALAEPDLSADAAGANAGQSLILATDEIFYRTKAADVWWMLRDMVGNAALQQALARYRAAAAQEKEPSLFQKLLEQTSKKDLEWFFDDWVYRDRGLPDLTIANVVPRKILGRNAYLVAVEVANDGYAAAEVPVTVRAGAVSLTERLLVPARAHATTRIVFDGPPQEVQVNDGSVPELRATVHRKQIQIAHAQ
ncbi:MAG: M1 family aminopeptidase [Acidobacteriaceae bacterium]|nr:M1 family aminopeptidase [Acidobacteriaceae bacterium]